MAKFTLYWRDGKREVVEGRTIAAAMSAAGYGNGSLRALNFWSKGDDVDYEWNAQKRGWIPLNKIGILPAGGADDTI